ncbi:hypothetical protein T4D_8228 [Trichinella pseudospiralis]|uniref:Uncharacterized protein n=1 Tax=Trichinella pseudospiralis TaxID=6337 RepID=A0A0V1DL16_TRIPS|nr:hypothetical protein T4D_8228 [Trichinella pseudospiralis]
MAEAAEFCCLQELEHDPLARVITEKGASVGEMPP